MLTQVKFTVHTPGADRIHYVNEQDVRVLLGRLPHQLWSQLRAVHFNDQSRGNRTLGYVTVRGRKEIALCALPPRIRLTKVLRNGQTPEKFGAVIGPRQHFVSLVSVQTSDFGTSLPGL
jgi:hypothetical protein